MHPEWVLSIQEQCKEARIPFFFKQWGGVRKKVNGRILQGRTHNAYPVRVQHPMLPTGVRIQYASEVEQAAWGDLVY
jgi:hypothetical protein